MRVGRVTSSYSSKCRFIDFTHVKWRGQKGVWACERTKMWALLWYYGAIGFSTSVTSERRGGVNRSRLHVQPPLTQNSTVQIGRRLCVRPWVSYIVHPGTCFVRGSKAWISISVNIPNLRVCTRSLMSCLIDFFFSQYGFIFIPNHFQDKFYVN